MTRRIASDIAWLVSFSCALTGAIGKNIKSSSSATTVARVMKYGMMAMMSMMFIMSLRKLALFGHEMNLEIVYRH